MALDTLFQFTIENAGGLIIFFENDGRISYVNKTVVRMLEYGDSIQSTLISDIFPSIFSIENGKLVCNEKIGGVDIVAEAYRKNRTCFTCILHLFEVDGRYTLIGYDATEQIRTHKQIKEVDEQIKEALKVKSEFTANVTHELRTPVNGISGNTRELLEVEDDPKKVRLLQLIERGCQDMHAIINNVLDFSKLEAGKFTLESREFVFKDMIDYAVSNHKNKINEKGLDFYLTIAPDIPEKVIGDELRIVQILNNLLSNAVKFTSVGKIMLEVVKTSQVGNKIELFFLVIDSGIGIAKENQDKLFQSFSQVDASISRKFGGTGLGLNITKQLVEMMGGHIHLESEYGKGSMFSFHIWVEVPDGEVVVSSSEGIAMANQDFSLDSFGVETEIWKFGSNENLTELSKKMSKLILCIDMENWEKAEGFADTVKKLTAEAPKEIKTTALRLKMSVQKEDVEKANEAFENLTNLVDSYKAEAN